MEHHLVSAVPSAQPRRLLAHVFILLAAFGVAACSTLPPKDSQRPSSALRDTAGTRLDTIAVRSLPAGENGFKLLPEPETALEARLALISQAERTLDLQYFVWQADTSGRLLLKALRDAAGRGVRVRLLLDDLYTTEVDALLQGLTGFPGVEVRLFNPFPSGRGSFATRIVSSLDDLTRVRHRMHNKLFVADNAIAITGGRNIGDAYLAAGSGDFFDVDVLAAGPIVREMSESFDDYWNSDQAYDGQLFWPASSPQSKRESFANGINHGVEGGPTRAILRAPTVGQELASSSISLQVCEARFFADPVEKAAGVSLDDSSGTLHQRLIYLFSQTQRELHIVSPYFVRGQIGLQRIKTLRDRGVRLEILTNSLSTTDEPLAHFVYLRYRKPLLQLGVNMREFIAGDSPADGDRNASAASAGRLHAKLAVVDRRYLYVGSLNFTSRSERINTELGLILDCPALAAQVLNLVEGLPAFELKLATSPLGIQWVDRRREPERVWDVEPEVSFWQRLKSMVLGQFVPEEEI